MLENELHDDEEECAKRRLGEDREVEPEELIQAIAEAGGAVAKVANDLGVILFAAGA